MTENASESEELTAQAEILDLIRSGAPLKDVLDASCRGLERELDGAMCSVMLVDASGTHLRAVAGPSLPPSFLVAVDGLSVTGDSGPCGRAVATEAPYVAEDIDADPTCSAYRAIAIERYGLRACASTPVRTPHGDVVGTVGVYHRSPWRPSAAETLRIAEAARLAGMAVERDREDAVRA